MKYWIIEYSEVPDRNKNHWRGLSHEETEAKFKEIYEKSVTTGLNLDKEGNRRIGYSTAVWEEYKKQL